MFARTMFTVALIVASFGSSTSAAEQGRTVKQLKRYRHRFKQAHDAILNGAVRPHATIRSVGLQGFLIVVDPHLRGGIGEAIANGLSQRYLVGQGGVGTGVGLGLPAEGLKTMHFGMAGARAEEIIPRRYTTWGDALGYTKRHSEGSVPTPTLEKGWASRFSVGPRTTWNFLRIKVGKPRPSRMLTLVREGLQTAEAGLNASGVSPVASLRRLKYLWAQIAAEKQQLNKDWNSIPK